MNPIPNVILAPMQGVLDPFVRNLLTSVNDYDLCISEFVRVVDQRLPKKTFYRLAPELYQGGLTDSGTPVRVQLLGQHPQWLAENAALAIELGSHGVDLNCGCPSKTVNGSNGGASLLKDPELIYRATKAMREAVPSDKIVSVKVRLGWDSVSQCFEIADAVEQGGANEITVHGRTKVDGYRAERINWQAIGEIQQRLSIPVIANGEIWDFESAKNCQKITACKALMMGRGALNTPNLSKVVKYNVPKMAWNEVLQLLFKYVQMENQFDTGFYHVARIKQWLRYLDKEYPQAVELFDILKTEHGYDGLKAHIEKAVEE
ncbi:TPA: tRNA dihydrouridine(16) synthase DusC [Mannheimia haemolytica]|uniref:tRNA-dihydrouridine(16) synthase n=1 Tax=Mannheimia haemolytica TaxID=75985 RepID=A0A248ZZR4_MANHA|nr:tRNA dihydrouridine(16) synthase DusC [Mannheimia haemolytica]AWW71107.1 tRNA dihydrouridine(16) synthase DusC [Pasteurellaceae bacterium 12565]AGI32237.1 tRNA dihydrouridine(16) synthase DusC [Mannheimia haemolytica USDA-ARS-USMARC-183]AGI35620.1 tRNA dihydrouridine(16) synthase DusC [Mannheimia haemolytica USDA-ARS-USMARC-185]AGK02934.1 tRNA-dihydrouridine synthase DusC [Mannheimia haemolytica M42548]AGQ25033.1 tRNA-dihydrouridine synthase C [Mannheimia haemolytica D153]